jgi:glycosyl transferase family 87
MPAFILLNGGSALLATLVAWTTRGGDRAGTVVFTALCVYLIVIHSVVLLSGLAGNLTVGGAAVVLLGMTAAATWLAWRIRGEPPGVGPATDRVTAADWYLRLAGILAGAVWMWPHLVNATRLWIWDDYTYHMVYPALWLREHAIAAVTPVHAFTMQAWFPLSASVVAVWFMLPFHGSRGDALAWVSLTGLLYAAMIVCGAATLLRRLGCRPGAWVLVLVLLATSQRIVIMASSFSDADLAQAAALFAAFTFTVPRKEDETSRDVKTDAWCAGLLSGIALGIKVSAIIPGLVLLTMVAFRPAAPARVRSATWTVLAFMLSWALTAGYWYARNLFYTGNPFYPAAVLIWPGTTFPETRLVEYSQQYGFAKAVLDALAVYMNWPPFHAAMAVIGLLGLAGWLVWRRRSLSKPQAYFAVGALVIVASVVILLPATPFSAGNAMTFRSGFVHWDSMRYVGLLPILGWVALAFLIDAGNGARSWRMFAAVVIVSTGLMTSGQAGPRSPLLLVTLACGAYVLSLIPLRGGRWKFWEVYGKTLAAGIIVLLVLATAFWQHDRKARVTSEAFYQERFFGGAVAVLDRQRPGTRVAVFGDQWIFPTFGGGDHLESVRLDRDGRLATVPIDDAMEPGNLAVEPSTFLSNMKAAGVEVVAVVHLPHPGRSPEWPTQQAALEGMPSARLLFLGEAVAIWALDEGPLPH